LPLKVNLCHKIFVDDKNKGFAGLKGVKNGVEFGVIKKGKVVVFVF
jgi:hypothetical protein